MATKALTPTEKVLARLFPGEIERVKYGTDLAPLTYGITCPSCGEGNSVEANQLGCEDDCRFCGERFAIPKRARV